MALRRKCLNRRERNIPPSRVGNFHVKYSYVIAFDYRCWSRWYRLSRNTPLRSVLIPDADRRYAHGITSSSAVSVAVGQIASRMVRDMTGHPSDAVWS